MDHDQVNIALLRDLQRCAGARSHMTDANAGILLELVLKSGDDTRINGADGAGHEDESLCRIYLRRESGAQ